MKAKVTTKFVTACNFTETFDSRELAGKFVEDEIEHLQCFYNSVNYPKRIELVIMNRNNSKGDLIRQVFLPVDVNFKQVSNLLVIYRIENINDFLKEVVDNAKDDDGFFNLDIPIQVHFDRDNTYQLELEM